MNSSREFDPQPPVYAVLTDLEHFYFFRYDGNQFFRSNAIIVLDMPRSEFLAGMRHGRLFFPLNHGDLYFLVVSEQLFSILLEGYVGMLAAVEAQSSKIGDVSS